MFVCTDDTESKEAVKGLGEKLTMKEVREVLCKTGIIFPDKCMPYNSSVFGEKGSKLYNQIVEDNFKVVGHSDRTYDFRRDVD